MKNCQGNPNVWDSLVAIKSGLLFLENTYCLCVNNEAFIHGCATPSNLKGIFAFKLFTIKKQKIHEKINHHFAILRCDIKF